MEVHRCRNYGLVRKANDFQTPLIPERVSISPEELRKLNLRTINNEEMNQVNQMIEDVKQRGFNYITLDFKACRGEYRWGVGIIQAATSCDSSFYLSAGIALSTIFLVGIPDLAAEAGKQVINIIVYPIKAIINGIHLMMLDHEFKKFNQRVMLAQNVLNLENSMGLIGKTRQVSGEEFAAVAEILKLAFTLKGKGVLTKS